MPSPKRKRIPSFIKTVFFVFCERRVGHSGQPASDAAKKQIAEVLDRVFARVSADWGKALREHLRATREPRARDQWEHATLGTVTVARVESGMVVAYASSGPAENGGRLSVPVGDWWAFVEGCDLLEVAEDSE